MPCLDSVPERFCPALAALAALAAFVTGAANGAAPPPASADEPAHVLLLRAGTALEDGVAPLAEALARSVHESAAASPGERESALDILVRAIAVGYGPAEVLARLDAGDLGEGVAVPADGRAALWRADALEALGRGAEAVETLRGALPLAARGVDRRIQRRIPSALLAAGETNDALVAYARLAADLRRWGSPEAPAMTLAHARILHALGRDAEAAAELDPSAADPTAPFPPDLQTAARLVRAEALATTDPALSERLLREAAADTREANRPHRAAALLRLALLEGAASPTNALPCALAAAEVAPDAATVFAAWSVAAEASARAGLLDDTTEFLRRAAEGATDGAGEAFDALRARCADALLEAGNAEAALTFFDALAAAPTSGAAEARALFGRGRCLAAQGRHETAAIAFTRAAELAGPPLRGAALYRAAEALHAANDPARAAEAFAQAADPASGLDPAHRERAAFLEAECIAAADPARGAAALGAFAAAHPGSRDTALALLRVAFLASPDDAPAAHARATAAARAASDPEVLAEALVREAVEAARRFDFEAARRNLAEAAALPSPRAAEAAYLHALALFDLGLEDDADAVCERLRTDPSAGPWAADAVLWLGSRRFNAGLYDEAAVLLGAFANDWPDRPEAPEALLATARALVAAKRWDEASEAATRAAALPPDSPFAAAARALQGEVLQQQMLYDEAILVYDDILRSWPDSSEARSALFLKGACLFALGIGEAGRYAEAEECFRQILAGARFPDTLAARYRIGRCLEKRGLPAEAFQAYYDNVLEYEARPADQPASASDPADPYTRSLLNAAELAATHGVGGGRPTALRLLSRLAGTDLPGHAKAEEALRRLRQQH